MFRRFALFIFHSRWPVFLGLLLVTVITGQAVFRLQIDPSMETLFNKKSPEYLYYRQASDRYGSDQMVAVAMSTPNLFTEPNLKELDFLTRKIAEIKNVERALSLANASDIKHKFAGIKVVPALDGALNGQRPLPEIKENILSNELFANNLVSKDGRVANILVYLKPVGKDLELSGKVISEIRALLISEEKPGTRFYIAGSPVEQYDFIHLIRKDQFTFVPLITLLLILTTFIIYRSFACMVLAMSIVFMTLCWTMGTIAILGQQLNLMTSLLAPVIMIVSVVNSIYLMNLFFEIRTKEQSLRESVAMTIEQLGVPCFLTHFTSILGFISLSLTPVPAIQSFGIFAALGTFFSYIVEIVLTPILLPILPYRMIGHATEEEHVFNRMLVGFLEKLDFQWKWWIIAVTVLVVTFSWQGISRLEVDTNMIKQMKPDLPLAISTRFIDQHLTGVYSLSFVFKREDGGSMAESKPLRMTDEFKTYLEAMPAISKVNSIGTVVKTIHAARNDDRKDYKIPEKDGDIRRYFDGIAQSGDPEVWKMLSPDYKEIRLEARMKAVGTTAGAEVEKKAREYLKEHLDGFLDYQITGSVVLLGKMAKDLVDEQLRSFGFAFLSILIVVMIIFRSWKLGLLAAIPNLIPILGIYGLMGYANIELSTPTAMISSIVLGLVVDASIQFLYRFRLEFQQRHHYIQALHYTYSSTGMSMFVSTLILSIGFASSIFASFRPTVHFGVLTSLTIFFAFICTLVVLPVALLMVRPFGRQRLFAHLRSKIRRRKKTHKVH